MSPQQKGSNIRAMTHLAPEEAIKSWLDLYGGSEVSAANFLCDRHATIPEKVALFYEDAHGQVSKWRRTPSCGICQRKWQDFLRP